MDPKAIASAGVPVLCIDTCSLLDIMRDPTRESARVHDRQGAVDLVASAEAGQFICLMAEQVAIEFAEHDQRVQEEADSNLRKVREQIKRINLLSAVYGAPGTTDLSHLDDHVARARTIVGRWLARLETVVPGSGAPARAFARVNAGRAPAQRGKDSTKDCLVYETYLEAVGHLRDAGLAEPIVFLSSNTREYVTEGSILKPDIVADFEALGVDYAPNMSAAKHLLAL